MRFFRANYTNNCNEQHTAQQVPYSIMLVGPRTDHCRTCIATTEGRSGTAGLDRSILSVNLLQHHSNGELIGHGGELLKALIPCTRSSMLNRSQRTFSRKTFENWTEICKNNKSRSSLRRSNEAIRCSSPLIAAAETMMTTTISHGYRLRLN